MIIQKIEIEQFGGLKDYTLTLSPGLQYLYGDNEAGKSTLCAFLAAMFYGLPGKVRGGGLRGDSRRLYMPWGGTYMAGTVYFEDEGQAYVLKRRFGQTARGDRCSLLSAADWQEIPADPETLGQRFLGVGEDAFRKTLFISQLGAAFSKGREDELMSRLSNLEHSGDEDASLQKALAELEKAGHELITKTGRGGAVVQLSAEAERLEAELAAAKQKHEAFRGVLEDIQRLTAEKEQAAAQLAAVEKQRAAAAAFGQYQLREQKRQSRRELESRLESEQAALTKVQNDLSQLAGEQEGLAGAAALAPDILLQMAEKDAACRVLEEKEAGRQALAEEIDGLRRAAEEAREKSRGHVNIPMLLVAAVVLAIAIAGGFFLMPVLYGLAAISLLLGMVAFLGSGGRRQAKKDWETLSVRLQAKQQTLQDMEQADFAGQLRALREDMQAVLAKAGAADLAALSEKTERVRTLLHREETLQKEARRLADSLQALAAALDRMAVTAEEPKPDYEGPDAETLDRQLARLREMQMERERTLAQLTARAEQGFAADRSVSVIETELLNTRQKMAELSETHEAIELALRMLEACGEELKSSFAPVLNEKSGALIARLTEGRYREIKVTDDYGMMLKTPDGNEIVESGYVSAGTCDLLYFALRLAVLQTLYDRIPLLIMDDTFIQLDAGRQQAAFSLLAENPAEQILYFSCHRPAPTWPVGTVRDIDSGQ